VVVSFFTHKERIERTLHTKAFTISTFQALILNKMKNKIKNETSINNVAPLLGHGQLLKLTFSPKKNT
jgi:hypothetical protein